MEQYQHILGISFEQLTQGIIEVSQATKARAAKAIDSIYPVRNWLVGAYIVEYEQNGLDRAIYGDKLLKRLAERLKDESLNTTTLKVSRNFYLEYPSIKQAIEKSATLSHLFQKVHALMASNDNVMPLLPLIQKGATLSHQFKTDPEKLINSLSFSHIRELLTVDDPLARYFYEFECIRGTWR